MTSSDFVRSDAFKNRVQEVIKTLNDEDTTPSILEPILTRILLDSFNDGIIANMGEKEKISKETLLKKSKEITKLLPAHFKNTDVGKKINETILQEILNNTTDYVLNIGYESVLQDAIAKTISIAYAIGITTGFEIASDKEMKSIYTSNQERFMNSGKIGEV